MPNLDSTVRRQILDHEMQVNRICVSCAYHHEPYQSKYCNPCRIEGTHIGWTARGPTTITAEEEEQQFIKHYPNSKHFDDAAANTAAAMRNIMNSAGWTLPHRDDLVEPDPPEEPVDTSEALAAWHKAMGHK